MLDQNSHILHAGLKNLFKPTQRVVVRQVDGTSLVGNITGWMNTNNDVILLTVQDIRGDQHAVPWHAVVRVEPRAS